MIQLHKAANLLKTLPPTSKFLPRTPPATRWETCNIWQSLRQLIPVMSLCSSLLHKSRRDTMVSWRKKQLVPNLHKLLTTENPILTTRPDGPDVIFLWRWKIGRLSLMHFCNSTTEILQDKGKVTAAIAKAFAESEFEKYRVIQDKNYQSDFDRLMAETAETKYPNWSDLPKVLEIVWFRGLLLFISCHFRIPLFSDPNADPNGS